MARNWAPGDSQVYRVKIVRRRQISNPNYQEPQVVRNDGGRWVRIERTPGEERNIFTDENPRIEYYGPYHNKSTARAMVSRETKSTWGQRSIISADIEKGSIIWEVLDE